MASLRDDMYQPYPGSAQMPKPQRPPASLRGAVLFMYAGAAASLAGAIVDFVTRNATVRALQSAAVKAHAPLISSSPAFTTVALVTVLGVISVGLWISIARASLDGRRWARTMGTVLFGINTVAVLIGPPDMGYRAPAAALARIFVGIVWLAGLAAVVFLWQKSSRSFFRAGRSS
jgi:hypothetical protein